MRLHVVDTHRGIHKRNTRLVGLTPAEIDAATPVTDGMTTYFDVSALTGTELTDALLSELSARWAHCRSLTRRLEITDYDVVARRHKRPATRQRYRLAQCDKTSQ
jgi:hypothetical protein